MAQISVKVYYVENEATKEIRKFVVDGELAENFEYLVGKIRSVFPDLLRKALELFWKDDEDDYISLSSNEELSQAVNAVPAEATCLKIFVKVAKQEKKSEEESIEHPGVTCDGCDKNINGVRYKCTNCFDFDLCSTCEPKGLHPADHELLCIKKPRTDASTYVMRAPFGRGCHRGRGFFGRRGRGHFGDPRGSFGAPRSCFGGPCGPFGARGGHCSKQQRASYEKGNDQQNKGADQQNQEISEMIRHLAAGFGFDPDVAESHLNMFLNNLGDNLHGESTQEDWKPQNKADVASSNQEKAKEKVGADVPVEQTMDTDADTSSEQANSASTPENVEQVMNDFAKKLGFNPNQQGENPFANLGEVVGKVFESLSAATAQKQDTDAENQALENQKKQKEDFIVVDSNPADAEQLTEEQKYELRLEKAIKQMESMGFDNEGGWVRQLLISKDLSIGKVLDALNPSN